MLNFSHFNKIVYIPGIWTRVITSWGSASCHIGNTLYKFKNMFMRIFGFEISTDLNSLYGLENVMVCASMLVCVSVSR